MSGRAANSAPDTAEQLSPRRQQNCPYPEFGFAEHLNALHPPTTSSGKPRKGRVILARKKKDGDWDETACRFDEIVTTASKMLDEDPSNVFVTQNVFRRRSRCTAELETIGAVWSDVDYYKSNEWSGRTPEAVAAAVLEHLADKRIPMPSYILSTGCGLLCVWLITPLPAQAEPRWSAVQRHILANMEDFAADNKAIDASRIFRVVGGKNSKIVGAKVQLIWCQSKPDSLMRYDFGYLADEILPETQASIKANKAARRAEYEAKKTARVPNDEGVKKPSTRRLFTSAGYYELVLKELEAIRKFRSVDGRLPAGGRNSWLFCAAIALTHIQGPEAAADMAVELGLEATGWPRKEVVSSLSTTMKRARKETARTKRETDGNQIRLDERYKLSVAKIIDLVEITEEEMSTLKLTLLLREHLKKRRANMRRVKSRQRHGGKSRDEQKLAKLEIGRKCNFLKVSEGMTVRELAIKFGHAVGYISTAMALAQAA